MRYEELRPKQIREAIEKRTPVVLPLGVIEYHSGHLPLGVDGFVAEHALREYEKEAEVILMPTFWYGAASRAVAPQKGSGNIDVKAKALVPIAKDIFRSLLDTGFRNIHTFVFHQCENFYRGGMPTDLAFKMASKEVIFDYLEEKRGEGWWGFPEQSTYYTDHDSLDANPFDWIRHHSLMPAEDQKRHDFVADHAGEGETSLMMRFCPDLVHMEDHCKDEWFAQSALEATRESGERGLQAALDQIRRVLAS